MEVCIFGVLTVNPVNPSVSPSPLLGNLNKNAW